MFLLDLRHNLHNLMHKHDILMQMPLGVVFVHACRKQRRRVGHEAGGTPKSLNRFELYFGIKRLLLTVLD